MQENDNTNTTDNQQKELDSSKKVVDSSENLVVPTSVSSENSTKSDILEDIKENTNEYNSMKEIHRQYNDLSGFQSMLHIIKAYRIVLYPFLILSIIGSAYSFYNDFIIAFPMLNIYVVIGVSVFLSIVLEVVRDGSMLALFNSKMKSQSRILVSLIFLVVTIYMFYGHINAISVINKSSVEYHLKNQSDDDIAKLDPKMNQAQSELSSLNARLESKMAEKTPQLLENANSIHQNKREDAIKRIEQIDNDIAKIEADISSRNGVISSSKTQNISKVQEKQDLVSVILFGTLIIVESLAMLGAVIKYIAFNNADREIAKNSEILEEYINVADVLKKSNIAFQKAIATTAQRNAQNGLDMIERMGTFDKQLNDKIALFMATQAPIQQVIYQTQPQVQTIQTTPTYTPQSSPRRIGFNTIEKDEIIKALYDGGNIKEGEKLVSKTHIINPQNRTEDKNYKMVVNELVDNGYIEFKKGYGYYAVAPYTSVIK
jgi:hypothetical protein